VGSILTGLYPNRHRGEDNEDKLSTEVEKLAEVLKSNGYTTIYITPNDNSSKLLNFDQGVDFLKEKDLYENSVIVLVSDHGEQFDEHIGMRIIKIIF
jgi:arylsulfatase A-like enzyme